MARDLAVIIPHFQDFTRLRRCLEALRTCEGLDWTDIVIVHSGVTTHDFTFEADFPGFRFLHQPKPGAGPARSFGVEATSAPLLLFLDCDCVPDRQLLIEARKALQDSAIAGGHIELFDETSGRRNGAQAFETVFAFRQQRYIALKNFAVTANLATTRQVFEDVGPFSDALAEDRDWCHRAVAKSYTISFAPSMRVRHPTRGSWTDLIRKWRRLIREDLAGRPADRRAQFYWHLRMAALPVSILRDLPRLWLSPDLHGLAERLRGSLTLIRLRLWRILEMSRAVRHRRRQFRA